MNTKKCERLLRVLILQSVDQQVVVCEGFNTTKCNAFLLRNADLLAPILSDDANEVFIASSKQLTSFTHVSIFTAQNQQHAH